MSVPPRTTSALVQALLEIDYGPISDGITNPDLTPYIATASMIIDQAKKIAIGKGAAYAISDTGINDQAELLERWMAAWAYCVMDPNYKSKTTKGASGNYEIGQEGEGFASNKWGRAAMAMDYSGALKNLSCKQRASAVWLGKPASAQIPYRDRN